MIQMISISIKDDQKAEMEAADALRAAMEQRAEQQRGRIERAIASAGTLVNAVNDDTIDVQVKAAEDAIKAINTAIMDAANVPENEQTTFTGTQTLLQGQLNDAKESRDMAMKMTREAVKMHMMATATKGISEQVSLGSDELLENLVETGEVRSRWRTTPTCSEVP